MLIVISDACYYVLIKASLCERLHHMIQLPLYAYHIFTCSLFLISYGKGVSSLHFTWSNVLKLLLIYHMNCILNTSNLSYISLVRKVDARVLGRCDDVCKDCPISPYNCNTRRFVVNKEEVDPMMVTSNDIRPMRFVM